MVTSLQIPTRKLYLLFILALRLERGGIATMVARFSDRRAGQKLLSTTLLQKRWSSLVSLQQGSDGDEIPSDDPRQRQPGQQRPDAFDICQGIAFLVDGLLQVKKRLEQS